MEIGMKHTVTIKVTEDKLASSMGSGTLPVFATPCMILLIERTCMECVMPSLEEGKSTVGTQLNVAHSDSTPLGADVTCVAELIEIDRRRLVFKAEVSDNHGIIGSGTHERFVVDNEKFMSKTNNKL